MGNVSGQLSAISRQGAAVSGQLSAYSPLPIPLLLPFRKPVQVPSPRTVLLPSQGGGFNNCLRLMGDRP
jgi:hypothetical protein